MPMYAYKGVNAKGKKVSGLFDAESPKALRQTMRKDGVTVLEQRVTKSGKKESGGKGLNREFQIAESLGIGGVSKQDIALFCRQLGTMLRAGTPLAEALTIQFEQSEKPQLQSIVGEVRTAVNEGTSLANAVRAHPKVFDHLFVSMISSGEQAGNLEEVLIRIAEFTESSVKMKSKIIGAMIYPVIMMAVGGLVVVYLLTNGIPKIAKIFETRDVELPPLTKFLIGLSDLVIGYWWLMIILFVGSIVGFVMWKRTEDGKKTWDRWILKIKGIGSLARKIAVARFARTLGTMLKSGVSILAAMETARDVMGNHVLMSSIDVAREDVQQGDSLSNALKKTGEFPGGLLHMIKVGERTGDLDGMLLHVADEMESDIDTRLERLTAVIGPLMLILMAGFVVMVVVSVLGPMQEIQQAMRR